MPDLSTTRDFLTRSRPLSLHARLGIALVMLESWWRARRADVPAVDAFLDYCWRFSSLTGEDFMEWHDHEDALFSVVLEDRAPTPEPLLAALRDTDVDVWFLRTQLRTVALMITEGMFCQPDEREAFRRLTDVVHALTDVETALPPLAPFEAYRLACCMLGPYALRPTRPIGPFFIRRRGDWGDRPPPDVLASWRALADPDPSRA